MRYIVLLLFGVLFAFLTVVLIALLIFRPDNALPSLLLLMDILSLLALRSLMRQPFRQLEFEQKIEVRKSIEELKRRVAELDAQIKGRGTEPPAAKT